MENVSVNQTRKESSTNRVRSLLLPISIVVLVAVVSLTAFRYLRNVNQEAQAAKIAEKQATELAAIEDRWGIRILQVTATADGGLVDLRYQITDPNKAIFLYDDIGNFPKLVTEDGGVEIAINNLSHEHDLEFGRTYFVLYRNVVGAVKPGGLVTVSVGDLSLEHFQVES
jgi:hypothetical protein